MDDDYFDLYLDYSEMLQEARAENAKLRELVRRLYGFSFDEYPDGTELNFADDLRELGIEVDG